MKNLLMFTIFGLLLAACSSTNSNTVAYGEIKGGIESTHHH